MVDELLITGRLRKCDRVGVGCMVGFVPPRESVWHANSDGFSGKVTVRHAPIFPPCGEDVAMGDRWGWFNILYRRVRGTTPICQLC